MFHSTITYSYNSLYSHIFYYNTKGTNHHFHYYSNATETQKWKKIHYPEYFIVRLLQNPHFQWSCWINKTTCSFINDCHDSKKKLQFILKWYFPKHSVIYETQKIDGPRVRDNQITSSFLKHDAHNLLVRLSILEKFTNWLYIFELSPFFHMPDYGKKIHF